MSKPNVLSFSLFLLPEQGPNKARRGRRTVYLRGARINLRLAKAIYPDWQVWYYVGRSSVPEAVVEELRDAGAKIILWDDTDRPWRGLLERLRPIGDPNVGRVRVCDIDSSLNWRERAAVDRWIESKRSWLVMRDHKYHSKAMIPDMIAATGGAVPGIGDMIDRYTVEHTPEFFTDMRFLCDEIWPGLDTTDVLQLDSQREHPRVVENRHGETEDFPAHRDTSPCEWVGQTILTEEHIKPARGKHGDAKGR